MKTTLNLSSSHGKRHVAGFTLIELMITVAIVAILTAIAYPSYRNYVLRGQIVDATNALTAGSANMERWFQDNRTYVGGPCATAVTAGNFTVSCPTAPTAPGITFTLTATGSGPANGFSYSITETGTQSSVVSSPAPTVWRITCAATWELKAGQC